MKQKKGFWDFANEHPEVIIYALFITFLILSKL